ncbi:hypothetical protein [uncultured Rothia sp.]|uniref:hypothetical protein n=1 Tax=uncultured Rothia sp. TaxID=316088 RepID=UPI003217D7A2
MAEAKIWIGTTFQDNKSYYIRCHRCTDLRVFPVKHTALSHVMDTARDHLFHAHGVQHQKRKPRTFEQILKDAHTKQLNIIAQREKKGTQQCK